MAGLVQLVNDSDYREQLSQEAKEYAQKDFTWPAVAGKYLDIYQASSGGKGQWTGNNWKRVPVKFC